MTCSIFANQVLLRRIGPRPLLSGGMLIAAIGMGLLTRLGVHTSYGTGILPALIILGAGLGFTFPPAINTATLGLAQAEAGVGSAMVTTSQQIGASIGTSVLNTISASATTSFLVGKAATAQLIAAASVHADRTVFTVVAAVLVGGAVLSGLVVTDKTR
jgi:hypothetical protein